MQISVCDNLIVRANTTLQLPLINTATLRAWFKMRVTCLERQGLTQHLQMPVTAAPSMPIPLARQQPATRDEGQEDIQHEFQLPQNTAGTGKARRKRAAVKIQAVIPIAPSPSTSIPLLCVPSASPAQLPYCLRCLSKCIPRWSVQQYRNSHHSHQQQARPPCLLRLPHSPRLCPGKCPGLRHGDAQLFLQLLVFALSPCRSPGRLHAKVQKKGEHCVWTLSEIPRHMASITGCGGVGLFLHCPSLSGRTNGSSREIYERK